MNQHDDLDKFFKVLEQEREDRYKERINFPENEVNRIKWIEFQKTIDIEFWPIMDEYLTVLGKLWFGETMRLKGPDFFKQLVSAPAYRVSHQVYGPMAIFWVEELDWKERQALFNEGEYRLELYKRGFRCRILHEKDNKFSFRDDSDLLLLEFDTMIPTNREPFLQIFNQVYSSGPKEIYTRWKDWGLSNLAIENSPGDI